jgi:hypothetical protein
LEVSVNTSTSSNQPVVERMLNLKIAIWHSFL